MKKYKNFKQYLNVHYKDVIQEELISFLMEQKIEKSENKDIEIKYLNIFKVTFTKSEIEKVEFECYFKADYLFNSLENKGNKETDVKRNYFVCYFKGSFSEGFVITNKEMEIIDDEEFNEKFTDALVPVICKDEIDKYATKFLKYFCPEALEKSTNLQLKKILNSKDIYYYKASMNEKIYGKIYFADDVAKIYDAKNNIVETKVSKGTILINNDIKTKRKEVSFRNTIVHEAVHWFFHRNYFELRQLLDNTLTCAVCYKGGNDENSQIYWMEKQARALTPRILMPKKQFLLKYKELSKEIEEKAKTFPMKTTEKWHEIVVQLANFFGTSYQSVKYRLRDLNKHRADGVLNYVDNKYIKDFTFKANYLKAQQTFVIDRNSFIKILSVEKRIYNLYIENKIEFINNMVVLNKRKYIDVKNKRMTEYALNNAHECCVVFDVISEYDNQTKAAKKQHYMFNKPNSKKTKVTINKECLSILLKKIKDDTDNYEKQKVELNNDFTKDLNYYLKKSKYTQEELAEESDINIRYIRYYLKGTKKPSQIEVIRMAIAMNLSYSSLNNLLITLNMMINPLGTENQGLLICLMVYKDKLIMENIYLALLESGYGNLLKLSNKYIKNHNLDKKSE